VTAGVEGRVFALANQHVLLDVDAAVAVIALVNNAIVVDCKVSIGNK
jgi:hypothetical protein